MSKSAKRQTLGFVEIMKKLSQSGLSGSKAPNSEASDASCFTSLQERVNFLLGILNQPQRTPQNMLFFVMYDIESNKVRYQISKYLIRKGCYRIQRSIFLADLNHSTYEQIRQDLAEVQACYENHDSILIVPISSDYLHSMKIIGESIDIDLITHRKNVLFF